MTEPPKIKLRLHDLLRTIFDDDVADYPDGWDSLTQITLVAAVEKEFGVRLPAADIGKLATVDDLVAMVEARLPHP